MSKGDRVRLISTSDPYTTLTAGCEGTVAFVDDLGTVHVKWDNGSHLGLVPVRTFGKYSDTPICHTVYIY